jgi:hypothetical protein
MSQALEKPTLLTERYIRAAKLTDVQAAGYLVVNLEGHTGAIQCRCQGLCHR